MGLPVKTLFMNAVEVDLNSITQVAQVKRGQMVPTDKEVATYPFACFFEGDVRKTPHNRDQLDKFELTFWVYVKESETQTVDEQGDILDALIETLMLKTGTVLTNSHKILPVSSNIYYVDDQHNGLLQAVYEIELAHQYGDATTK